MEKNYCIILNLKNKNKKTCSIERREGCGKKGVSAQWVIYHLFGCSVLICQMDKCPKIVYENNKTRAKTGG
jgi:hypothetical protein